MTTTTCKEDYLGRNLTNATPGTTRRRPTSSVGTWEPATPTSSAVRSRPTPWATATAYAAGTVVYVAGGELTATVGRDVARLDGADRPRFGGRHGDATTRSPGSGPSDMTAGRPAVGAPPSPTPSEETSWPWTASQPRTTSRRSPGAPFDELLVEMAQESVRADAGWHIAPVRTETLYLTGHGGAYLPIPSRRIVSVSAVRYGPSLTEIHLRVDHRPRRVAVPHGGLDLPAPSRST